MKIATIVGARPQFVKAAVVSRALSQCGAEEFLIHTGQHFDAGMSDVFFEEMGIARPWVNLEVHGLSPMAMVGRMLEKLEPVLSRLRPDAVLVYGDTFSTLAGAIGAKQLHLPLAHVEAGLRSFNMEMPEEVNRILTDRIADLLFCPTQVSVDNLLHEGVDGEKIVRCGDVMQDAALHYASKAKKPAGVDVPDDFVLVTLHRAENTDRPERLTAIMQALETLARQHPLFLPLHPRTKGCLQQISYDLSGSAVHFLEPLGYLEMVWMLQHCRMVMTDSGGLQKEAYFFRKPCVTLRGETEWVELVEKGYNRLAGYETAVVLETFQEMWQHTPLFDADGDGPLYGDGQAGLHIARALLQQMGARGQIK